jgi:hypothetical protein
MSISKLIVLIAAFMLAAFLGSNPVSAQVCDPTDPLTDCDGDGIPNGSDPCNNLDPTADCDGDGIPNGSDPCNNVDPLADCDNDGVPNEDDECPDSVPGTPLIIDEVECGVSGLDTVLPSGCGLSESLAAEILACAEGAKNHGKFVSCVAKKTNALKKAKVISGNQKGQIQSCAAHSDIGKKPKK